MLNPMRAAGQAPLTCARDEQRWQLHQHCAAILIALVAASADWMQEHREEVGD